MLASIKITNINTQHLNIIKWKQISPFSEMMRSCKCFPHIPQVSTFIYNRANSVIIKNAIILNIITFFFEVPRQESERSCICVLGGYQFSLFLWFWDWSDSVVFIFIFHFVLWCPLWFSCKKMLCSALLLFDFMGANVYSCYLTKKSLKIPKG
jgi:hypothetical protein